MAQGATALDQSLGGSSRPRWYILLSKPANDPGNPLGLSVCSADDVTSLRKASGADSATFKTPKGMGTTKFVQSLAGLNEVYPEPFTLLRRLLPQSGEGVREGAGEGTGEGAARGAGEGAGGGTGVKHKKLPSCTSSPAPSSRQPRGLLGAVLLGRGGGCQLSLQPSLQPSLRPRRWAQPAQKVELDPHRLRRIRVRLRAAGKA